MPIKVKCGSCSAAFSAKDGLAGKTVKCPKCSSPLRVPAAAAQNAASVQGDARRSPPLPVVGRVPWLATWGIRWQISWMRSA